MSQRHRNDMVIVAHVREQHRLSLHIYGRPRMTEELQELGLQVGHRRVGHLMRENGIKIVRTQKYKVTTDCNHAFNIVPNLLDQDFSAALAKQAIESGEAIGMDRAGIARKVVGGMLTLPIDAELIPGAGRRDPAPRAFVPDITPEPSGFGLRCVGAHLQLYGGVAETKGYYAQGA